MVKRLVVGVLLALVTLQGELRAQCYESEARELSSLYRGRLQNTYHYRYNGTYYMFTRAFGRESVLYNGKRYDNVLLNVDAYSMDLISKPEENFGGVILNRDQVVWFTLNGRWMVNLRYLGFSEAPEGYFEVVNNTREPLLKLTRKVFDTDPKGNRITAEEMDGNYDSNVINYFRRQESWYTVRDGIVVKLSRRATRKKLREPQENSPLSPIPALGTQIWHPGDEILGGTVTALQGKPAGLGLPSGYFAEEQADTTDAIYAHQVLKATYRNKTYTIGEENASRGAPVISGTVFEAESGQPLPGVVVFDDNTATYVRTDRDGRYRISLSKGDNVLNFNAESKEDLALKVVILSSGNLDIVMTEKTHLLKGALISASSMEKHRTTAIGIETVSTKTLAKIPSAFGEGDIIKAVMTLPGVKSVGEASGGFNVRGGSADQNLVLFGENTIYNPTHLFGLFSAFNPDVVDHVDLYKSSIPARYGGRISSVLSVTPKEGDPGRVKGSAGLGLLTSRLHLEGPLVKGKTTFVAAARTTYSDWLLKRLPKESVYAGGGASFTDANISLTHRINSRASLQFFGYYARDRFDFSGDTTFHYNNLNASLVFRHTDDKGSVKVAAGWDHYGNTVSDRHWEEAAFDLQTTIRQVFLKAERTRVEGAHTLVYGADAVGYHLMPGALKPAADRSLTTPEQLNTEQGLEPALFASDTWLITPTFSVDAGVRLSSFLARNPVKFLGGPEWRLSVKYSPASNLSFKAGVNTMRQYIHLISNTASVSPMDTWRLSGAAIAPTTGWQGAAGAYWTLLGAGLDFSVEGYFKKSRNVLDYKSGAVLMMNPDIAEALVPVFGKAYGVEVMLKKPAGKITGWLSYCYSRSLLREMQDRGSETINGGDWYNAPHDKPHEFKMVGNFALTHRYSLSLNVDYATGRPITVPVGRYWYDGKMRLAYSERNSYRIPDYFRVDAAINIDPGHSLKAKVHTSFTLGVYNVTGRKNPYSVFFRTQPGGTVKGYMLSVFAMQIPYVNLNLLF